MHADLRLVFLYALTIFLSAFLLFQVQPLIGKMILPWFGGSAAVWTTCMLFFQVLLLLGYLYSHWIVRFLAPRRQSLMHIGLLVASMAVLPLTPGDQWRPTGAENPTWRILLLLAATIGPPYFVLSTTGPLIQAWFARERPGAVPYRLFALSNFGSLLALLAYPVAVEPWLPTRWQSWTWSGLFVGFVLLCALLAWHGRHGTAGHASVRADARPAPGAGTRLAWVALAACPSILLVADTSYMTENIAPIPLLWVVPLALYLLSFIFCFERRGWYQRWLFLPLLVVGLGVLTWLPTLGVSELPILLATSINLASFFVACMVCHGELARMQPHPAHLTGYYLMLAVGGALGGVFVGVVAPYAFNANYDLSIGLVTTAVVVTLVVVGGHRFSARAWQVGSWVVAGAVTLAIAYVRVTDHRDELENATVTTRNFYGTLRVRGYGQGEDASRGLIHGQIIHGRQFSAENRQDEPTAYYGREGGAGRALLAKAQDGPLRVGVIGLGVGTLAAYGRPGDYFRLYEIDPSVIELARSQFTFLSRTKATTELVLGDARLSLDREPPQRFDLLVADAFSGDSVPIHLLTREAFATYFRHLKPDGVLAIHVTNRFLTLAPVVQTAAESFGRAARIVSTAGDAGRLLYRSSWVLVSAHPHFFDREQLRGAAGPIAASPDFRIWRDDYSSILSVLK